MIISTTNEHFLHKWKFQPTLFSEKHILCWHQYFQQFTTYCHKFFNEKALVCKVKRHILISSQKVFQYMPLLLCLLLFIVYESFIILNMKSLQF